MLWGNTNSSNPVVQSDPDWFDASGYQDIVLWSQLGNCDGSAGTVLTLTYETAPIKSESTFRAMASVTLPLSVGPNVQVTPILMQSATPSQPVLARWVRWKLSAASVSGIWLVSFRVLASLNGPGPSVGM